MLFIELPFLERFEAARQFGFEGVEFLFPYSFQPDEIAKAVSTSDLPVVLFNTPPEGWDDGERGFAAVTGAQQQFRSGIRQAILYADQLNAAFIHVMSGITNDKAAEQVLIENLRWAAQKYPDQDFLIEPLNKIDMPGYFLNDFEVARRVIVAVGLDNLGLQFDAYHVHMMGFDLCETWRKNRDLTRHVQIAGAPGRHEPIPSEIDYQAFFELLVTDDYQGFVSGEYHPRNKTSKGLGWMG